MHYLGLDVGTRRTGAAFASDTDDILFTLPTISHTSEQELLKAVQAIVEQKQIDEVIIGLPLLPSGEEGAQADIAHSVHDVLSEAGITVHMIDERYTSQLSKDFDKDAAAACEILSVWLKKNKKI